MSKRTARKPPRVRLTLSERLKFLTNHYAVLALVGMAGLGVSLVLRGLVIHAIVLAVVGLPIVAGLLNWSPLWIAGIALSVDVLSIGRWSAGTLEPPRLLAVDDVVRTAAVGLIVFAVFRLQAFHAVLFSVDRRWRLLGKNVMQRTLARDPRSLAPAEIISFLIQVVAVTAIIHVPVTATVLVPRDMFSLDPRWTQAVLLIIFVVLGSIVFGYFLRYWRRAQSAPETALLALQDVAWNETRGEQRRNNRWLIWDRLRQPWKLSQTLTLTAVLLFGAMVAGYLLLRQ